MSEKKFKKHLKKIAKKRKANDYYDRFSFKKLKHGKVNLNLYILKGEKNAPCIVFMPGENLYSLLYADYLVGLNDAGYNVVAFDPRSHGISSGRKGSYVLEELLSDMDEVVHYTRKKISKNIFVSGSSQGGIVSFYYAAAHENQIKGAICHNVADLADEDSLNIMRYPKLTKLLKPFVVNFSDVIPELPVWLNWYLNLKEEKIKGLGNGAKLLNKDPFVAPYVRLKTVASLMTAELIKNVEEIKTPIYILHGDKDGIFPFDYIDGIYQRLRGVKRMKVHQGQHHYLIMDEVDSILPDIVDWIRQVDRSVKRPMVAISR